MFNSTYRTLFMLGKVKTKQNVHATKLQYVDIVFNSMDFICIKSCQFVINSWLLQVINGIKASIFNTCCSTDLFLLPNQIIIGTQQVSYSDKFVCPSILFHMSVTYFCYLCQSRKILL